MDNIKEKLLTAVQDGSLDGADVVDVLLNYLEEDTVSDIIENEGWEEACGIGMRDNPDDEEYQYFLYVNKILQRSNENWLTNGQFLSILYLRFNGNPN